MGWNHQLEEVESQVFEIVETKLISCLAGWVKVLAATSIGCTDGLVEPQTRKDERHSDENTGSLIFSPSSALDPLPPKKKMYIGSKFPQNMGPKMEETWVLMVWMWQQKQQQHTTKQPGLPTKKTSNSSLEEPVYHRNFIHWLAFRVCSWVSSSL